ncbi:MAG: succinyl-diaminopimelate desuccinylase [Rhodospirillales bacterium]|nr:succinyl-diaminopimelate desuccinylase [Rhodospirillales bacterium]
MTAPIDPVELARRLIRCQSVTPTDDGALDVLQTTLTSLGFSCHRVPFGEGAARVDNLYARLGTASPNFCFAGHTDVVPVGDAAGWKIPPFEARIDGGRLYGRGASDMKAAVACFAVAAERFTAKRGRDFPGSITLLITGDEEGQGINGTAKVLEWMRRQGETIDACLTGEPTNPTTLGEMIKIGRRGSLNAKLTVIGTQGHAAYPDRADNPIPRLLAMLTALSAEPLDRGNAHFQASTLVVTTVDVGNATTNVIPAKARAGFNIRFNDMHSGASLTKWIRQRLDAVGGRYELDIAVSGESFLTPPGRLSEVVAGAIQQVTGKTPELSTTGGTSDSRFIKDVCPVLDFGMVGQTMHQTNENVAVADVEALARIYEAVLDRYFAATPC